MKFVILLLIPIFIQSDLASVLSPDEQGFIVPGITQEYLPQPIFYEGYIPLVFEYQTPKWNKTEITFNNWYTCVSETVPYKYSCPVIFHMNQAIVNLHVDFEGIHPATDTNDEMAEFHFQRLTTSSEFCSKIHKHFSSTYTQASEIDKYLDALKRCRIEWGWTNENSDEQFLMQRNISDYNYGVRDPFARMENNFYNIFYENIASTANTSDTNSSTSVKDPRLDLIASALLSNARTTLQAGVLGVYYAEKNRWVHANSDCNQGLIPQSVVTKDKFTESIKNITMLQGFQQAFELSITQNLMSKYYNLPLTDCSHTSSDMMVVRVQIPFTKKNRSKTLQLVETHTLAFEYKGHVCRIKLGSQADHTPSGFFQEVRGSHFLYEELSALAFATDCKGNELCKISEYGLNTRNFADRCASALLARNHSVIRNHCQFQCRKQDLTETPLITRIRSNQYVLTGSPINISIQCQVARNRTTSFEYFIAYPRIGAHLLNLPCNCVFTLKNSDKLKHIKFFGECPSTTATNRDNSYVYGTRSLTFTKPEVIPIMPFHFARAKESHSPGDSFYYENLSPDAVVYLADFFDEERMDAYLSRAENPKHGPNHLPATATSSRSPEDNFTKVSQDGSCSSVTVLWVVFLITTLIIFTLQAYILYVVKRNERVSYPKDERILYKVPDSPVM